MDMVIYAELIMHSSGKTVSVSYKSLADLKSDLESGWACLKEGHFNGVLLGETEALKFIQVLL